MKQTTTYKDTKFLIEENLPEVGFYLYVFNSAAVCIADYLQNSETSIKQFALEEYGIPINSWKLHTE